MMIRYLALSAALVMSAEAAFAMSAPIKGNIWPTRVSWLSGDDPYALTERDVVIELSSIRGDGVRRAVECYNPREQVVTVTVRDLVLGRALVEATRYSLETTSVDGETRSRFTVPRVAHYAPGRLQVDVDFAGCGVDQLSFNRHGSVHAELGVELSPEAKCDMDLAPESFGCRFVHIDPIWVNEEKTCSLVFDWEDVSTVGRSPLKGYDLYRDGDLIASEVDYSLVELIDEPSGLHVYDVVAVYENGTRSLALDVVYHLGSCRVGVDLEPHRVQVEVVASPVEACRAGLQRAAGQAKVEAQAMRQFTDGLQVEGSFSGHPTNWLTNFLHAPLHQGQEFQFQLSSPDAPERFGPLHRVPLFAFDEDCLKTPSRTYKVIPITFNMSDSYRERYIESQGPMLTDAEIQDVLTQSSDWFERVSYGQTSIDFELLPTYHIDEDIEEACGESRVGGFPVGYACVNRWREQVIAGSGVQPGDYVVLYFYGPSPMGTAGTGQLLVSGRLFQYRTFTHELGHELGLAHTVTIDERNGVSLTGPYEQYRGLASSEVVESLFSGVVYGQAWDSMAVQPHGYNAAAREALGWLGPHNVINAYHEQAITLTSTDAAQNDEVRVLRVPINENAAYVFEARTFDHVNPDDIGADHNRSLKAVIDGGLAAVTVWVELKESLTANWILRGPHYLSIPGATKYDEHYDAGETFRDIFHGIEVEFSNATTSSVDATLRFIDPFPYTP